MKSLSTRRAHIMVAAALTVCQVLHGLDLFSKLEKESRITSRQLTARPSPGVTNYPRQPGSKVGFQAHSSLLPGSPLSKLTVGPGSFHACVFQIHS